VNHGRKVFFGLAILSLVAVGSPSVVTAADEGKLLYQVHCLACHGETGRGDGPMRSQLEISIPDLTTITSRNEGEFPTEKIHQVIDGRHESSAHGTRQMPVWGFTFQSSGRDSDQETEVRDRISALTTYLESIQLEVNTDSATHDSGN
jgi:mono/diheme cytochrome c family protein